MDFDTCISLMFLLTLPSSARAQIIPTQITCTGLQSQTYTPGLTYQQQNVTVSTQANLTCVSLSNPAITSATRTLQVTVPRSCNDLLNGGTAERTSVIQRPALKAGNYSDKPLSGNKKPGINRVFRFTLDKVTSGGIPAASSRTNGHDRPVPDGHGLLRLAEACRV